MAARSRQSLTPGVARSSLTPTARSSLAPTALGRMKQIREAKDMEMSLRRQAERIGDKVPPYEFLELIGKGAYGKVFKR